MTNSSSKFSFLMAVNRDDGFLKDAIESVLEQSVTVFDFYIIANNCEEDLWNFINTYKNQDSRIKAYRTSIGSLDFNLSYGLDIIKNGYILRIDADDICEHDRLEKTIALLAAKNYPCVLAGSAETIDSDGASIGRMFVPLSINSLKRQIWYRNPLIHPACAVDTAFAIAVGGYAGGRYAEDYDLWLRMLRDPDFTYAGTRDIMIKYRIHENQTRGRREAYARSCSLKLREFLLGAGLHYLLGTIISAFRMLVSNNWFIKTNNK